MRKAIKKGKRANITKNSHANLSSILYVRYTISGWCPSFAYESGNNHYSDYKG